MLLTLFLYFVWLSGLNCHSTKPIKNSNEHHLQWLCNTICLKDFQAEDAKFTEKSLLCVCNVSTEVDPIDKQVFEKLAKKLGLRLKLINSKKVVGKRQVLEEVSTPISNIIQTQTEGLLASLRGLHLPLATTMRSLTLPNLNLRSHMPANARIILDKARRRIDVLIQNLDKSLMDNKHLALEVNSITSGLRALSGETERARESQNLVQHFRERERLRKERFRQLTHGKGFIVGAGAPKIDHKDKTPGVISVPIGANVLFPHTDKYTEIHEDIGLLDLSKMHTTTQQSEDIGTEVNTHSMTTKNQSEDLISTVPSINDTSSHLHQLETTHNI